MVLTLSKPIPHPPPLPRPTRTRTQPFLITCRKKGIHPQFYPDAKVICNGELVLTTGGTQKEYQVDMWSGSCPFYLGTREEFDVNDEFLQRFKDKFPELFEGLDDFDQPDEPDEDVPKEWSLPFWKRRDFGPKKKKK